MRSSFDLAVRTGGAAALLFVTAFYAPSALAAQSGPAVSAAPTSSPNIWTITGTGFEPNLTLRVMAVSCTSVANCGGSGGIEGTAGPIFQAVTTTASGTFEVQLNFAGAKPAGGSTTFLVVAFPGSRALQPTDPFAEVPASAGAAPTPVVPPVGTGLAAGSGDGGVGAPLIWFGAVLSVIGAAALGGTWRRRAGSRR